MPAKKTVSQERLERYLAHFGGVSRRRAASEIKKGLVRVNNTVVDEPGYRINPREDRIVYDGRKIEQGGDFVYILLNKPTGYISTCKDTHKRKTVLNLVKAPDVRLYPVGRLDVDTSGILLLTNDGDLAYRAMHPKHELKKAYQVTVNGELSAGQIRKLRSGVVIDSKKTYPAKVVCKSVRSGCATYEIEIHEGRNRQIRKMFEAVGFKVTRLVRTRYGNLDLSFLKGSGWRNLKKTELAKLKSLLGIS